MDEVVAILRDTVSYTHLDVYKRQVQGDREYDQNQGRKGGVPPGMGDHRHLRCLGGLRPSG